MTLGRCPLVAGRIGMTVDCKNAVRDDIGLIAATGLGRDPSRRELKHLAEAASGPGGLHALHRFLARSWMIACASNRTAITETDIEAAAGVSTAAGTATARIFRHRTVRLLCKGQCRDQALVRTHAAVRTGSVPRNTTLERPLNAGFKHP